MKQKVYYLEHLDCANCGAKIEKKFQQLPEVSQAEIVFSTRQLLLTAEDPDALIEKLTKIARTVEKDITIRPQTPENSHCHACDCGDCHHSHKEHGKKQWEIPVGAGLFVLGCMFTAVPWFAAALFVAAYGILGKDVLSTAGKNIIKGKIFDENFLMSIATLGAFAIGEFPEAVGVMLFYCVGEYFEHRAVEKSRSQIMNAVDLRPETVEKVMIDGVSTIPAAMAQVGDNILVRPGDRIPLDGVVVAGESRIDTAPITGEPTPVHVTQGDAVISGCVNIMGQLTVRVEKQLEESMVSRILQSVEKAAAGKPKIQRFLTRFAEIYTPIVVGLAILVAVIPSLITGNWNHWIYTALSFLVMSCPCALVLSVPLAYFAGIGVGSRQGILFKNGLTMEAMTGIQGVVLDKTGTLTKGDFSLQELVGGEEVLKLCAICEQFSTHPIAAGVLAAYHKKPLSQPQQVEELAGLGIRAMVEGKEILCGNEKLMARFAIHCPTEKKVGTTVFVAESGKLLGWLRLGDTVKEDAAVAIAKLKSKNIAIAMLTGDDAITARAVGEQLGIKTVYARLLPDEKLQVLQKIRKQYGPVMFVGDGINDAVVLSSADVGGAMGSGADAAMEAADVVFLKSRVDGIPEALRIAAQTKKIALQTVIFALFVKCTVMLLGIFGFASMWAAVFADSGVAFICIAHAIWPLYRKKPEKSKA